MVQTAGAMPAKAKSPNQIAAAVKLNLCPQFYVMFAMLCYVMFAMLYFSAAAYLLSLQFSKSFLFAVFNVPIKCVYNCHEVSL